MYPGTKAKATLVPKNTVATIGLLTKQTHRWLNKYDNNMADSRGARCDIGEDGKLYMVFETDGGNHLFRYLPFDHALTAKIVGGDNHFTFANTGTEPKIFVGRYEVATGDYINWVSNIPTGLANGDENTTRTNNGAVAADRFRTCIYRCRCCRRHASQPHLCSQRLFGWFGSYRYQSRF